MVDCKAAEMASHGRGKGMKYAPAVIVALSFLPLTLVHLRNLGMDERYQHFPLVLVAVGVLLWTRWSLREVQRTRLTTAASWGLLIASVVLGSGAAVLKSPWLAFAATCVATAAFLLDWRGRGAFRFLPVTLLLLLMLPLPMRMDDALVIELQDISSRWASLLLDFFNVRHMLSGHIIEMPGAKFLIEEACSGVRSLFAMLALAAIFVVYERRGAIHAIMLILSSIVWSGAMNVLRIVSVVLSQLLFGIDVARGWKHDLLGLLVFVLGMLVLFCTDRLLLFFLGSAAGVRRRAAPATDGQGTTNAAQADVTDGRLRICTSWLAALAVLVPVGVPSTIVAGAMFWQYREDDSRLTNVVLSQALLPSQIAGWEQITFQQGTQSSDPTHGPRWCSWTYRKGDLIATVSFDFPFQAWHNLTVCYEGAGWKVADWEVRSAKESGVSRTAEVIRFKIEKPEIEYGVVFFNLFDSSGEMLPAPSRKDPAFADWLTGLKLRLARQASQLGFGRPNYQLQVVATGSPEGLSRRERDLEGLFAASFAKLAGSLAGNTAK